MSENRQSSPHMEPGPTAQQAGEEAWAAMNDRLAHMEATQNQLVAAIDVLVSGLLEVKQISEQRQLNLKAQRQSESIIRLQEQLKEVEHNLALERSCRELAEVSRYYPKQRRVIFMGAISFGDNVKYAWQTMIQRAHELNIDVWFLPPNEACAAQIVQQGGQCLPVHQNDWCNDDVICALSTAVLVTSDHLLSSNAYAASLLAGARHVQLWHGLSIKEVGYLSNMRPLKHMSPYLAYVLRTCGPFSTFVGTAAQLEPEWRRWFSFEHYATPGYPRTDVLYREPTSADLINVDMDVFNLMSEVKQKSKPVYLYAPTFRDANSGEWILDAGIARVAQHVHESGGLFVLNLHPNEQFILEKLCEVFPYAVFPRAATDLYPLLTQTSALITDYSSLIFDYLHTKRPILLFRPDHENYIARSRKLSDTKLSPLPGPVAETAEELIALLDDPQTCTNLKFEAARQTLAQQMFELRDGRAAERVCTLIHDELNRALTTHAR